MIGANVYLKGKNTGTITDHNGDYSISTPKDGILVFSILGFDNVEVAVDNRKVINITMHESSINLDEVVVVGYGAQQKKDPISWTDENWNPLQYPTVGIPFNYKQKHPGGWASGVDYYLLRLADILLLKAEALNETGNTAGAINLVNSIRNRVHITPLSNSLSKEVAKNAILNERRLELAFEAQRWDDLVRNGVATTVMQGLKEYTYSCISNAPGNPVLMDYSKCDKNHWLLPIPQFEIDANPNLTQNPGY